MTIEEAIESFKWSNKQSKLRLEVEKMRMDSSEIKELKFYIERNEMVIKALEQKPKTGHWFIDERPESDREIICSNCEQPIFKYHKLDFDYRPNYCPNCGARMESEE